MTYFPPSVDRIWSIWGSYYDIGHFYFLSILRGMILLRHQQALSSKAGDDTAAGLGFGV